MDADADAGGLPRLHKGVAHVTLTAPIPVTWIFRRRAWIARRFGAGAPNRRARGCPPAARQAGRRRAVYVSQADGILFRDPARKGVCSGKPKPEMLDRVSTYARELSNAGRTEIHQIGLFIVLPLGREHVGGNRLAVVCHAWGSSARLSMIEDVGLKGGG